MQIPFNQSRTLSVLKANLNMRIQALTALTRNGIRRAAAGSGAAAASAAVTTAYNPRRWLASKAKGMAGKEFDTTAAAMALRTGENNALAKTIADKPWVALTTAEKTTESVKTGMGGVVIGAGLALSVACIYFLGKEAKESIFGVADLGGEWREKALEKIVANPRAAEAIGRNARIARVGDTVEFETDSGSKECLRTTFLVMGDNERKCLVTLEIYKEAATGFTWNERFLLVDVQPKDLQPKFRIEVVKPVY